MGIKRAGWIVVMAAIVATIGCDRVTKHAAVTMLAGGPDHSYLADTVRLVYVENSGGFLSLGASWPSVVRTTFFTVATGVMLLTLTASGLAAGLLLWLAGANSARDAIWAAVGICGAGYALWAMGEALRHHRVGVDVIALLAVAGALAVGELLAAAVISVMLASGRALEAWAAGRARRDLRVLLERAPRSARRYRDQDRTLETVPLDAVAPGDLLLVAPGELVPVDGTVAQQAVGGRDQGGSAKAELGTVAQTPFAVVEHRIGAGKGTPARLGDEGRGHAARRRPASVDRQHRLHKILVKRRASEHATAAAGDQRRILTQRRHRRCRRAPRCAPI